MKFIIMDFLQFWKGLVKQIGSRIQIRLMSILYAHFISKFWLVFNSFYDINKCFDNIFIPICF